MHGLQGMAPNIGINRQSQVFRLHLSLRSILEELMSLDKALQAMKFDVRLLEYQLATGQITKEDYQKHLSQLQDSSDNSEKLDFDDKNSSQDQH